MSTAPDLGNRPAAAMLLLASLSLAGCSTSSTGPVGPTGSACATVLRPPEGSYPAAGGEGHLTVSTDRRCWWTASANDTWLSVTAIAITASLGQGPGLVHYAVAPNPSADARLGTLTIGDSTFTVRQAGAADTR